MISKERTLIYLLRITGGVMVIALLFVFCPTSWIDSSHQWLGLGPMPQGPIFQYLARTESALYTFFGLILLFISKDIARYQPLIRFLAWITIPLSIGVTILDAKLHLPLFWTLGEGPSTLLLGAILLFLTNGRFSDIKME
jgi:hypothetical protein